jgi:hypothetical protein
MAIPEPSKRIKRLLRELADRAYAEALRRELSKLHASFLAWQAGQMSPFDLAEEIHRFHQGPNRELYVRYTSSHHEAAVARAVAEGLIPESSLSEEVRIHLEPLITRFKEPV